MLRKIHILAAPTGAGKSTLTENPSRYLTSSPDIPLYREFLRVNESLPAMRAMGQDNYMNLSESRDEVFIHVDFWNAFSGRPIDLNEAYPYFNKEAFNNWKSLQYLYQIESVHIYTMFVSRPILFDRWIGREIASGYNKVNAKVANIYGNTIDRNRPFWCLYGAWFDFVNDLKPEINVVVEADNTPYRLVDFADWEQARKLLVVKSSW
ncbi:MAG: hypothetical protein DHS20C01_12100 [marine bacterium B5-7]|nr:MAG: hypothetical protein DHS20C01_12100 [marine bacterium B5-7]